MDKMIGANVSEETERKLRIEAAKLGLSKAEALRQAIALWLEAREKNNAKTTTAAT